MSRLGLENSRDQSTKHWQNVGLKADDILLSVIVGQELNDEILAGIGPRSSISCILISLIRPKNGLSQ